MSESRFRTLRAPLVGAVTLAATVALTALGTSTAHAQTVYLVGADFYMSSSNGTNTGIGTYQYDTNTQSGDSVLQLVYKGVTYGKGIAIPMTAGANNFTINVSPGNPADPGSYAGLGLFFDTSPTQYNPGIGRTPDLSYATATSTTFSSSGDFTPASGISVANYNFGAGTSPANGFISIAEGSKIVTVSNFTAAHDTSGTFTVNVGSAAAPEPGSLALLGVCLAPLAGLVARRRRLAQSSRVAA